VGRTIRGALALAAALIALYPAPPARAQDGPDDCSHVVVFTLPSVTWSDVATADPPALLEAVEMGATGSMSVRTNMSRTTLAAGFLTLGSGARVEGGHATGSPTRVTDDRGLASGVEAAGITQIVERAKADGYGAVPGSLGSALETPLIALGNGDPGIPPAAPLGYGRWSLLAAMDSKGRVDYAATAEDMLTEDQAAPYGVKTDQAAFRQALDESLALECSVVVADQGDLTRADGWATAQGLTYPEHRNLEAIGAADRALAEVMERLDLEHDLLLIVSPTSPTWASRPHLGVAVAAGPGFGEGESLESASTRRQGIVTLPDVAPTVLDHLGLARPAAMNGRPFSSSPNSDSEIVEGIGLDDEAVFIDGIKGQLAVAFIAFQVLVYALVVGLLLWRGRRGGVGTRAGGALETAALAVVAFPVATFLAGMVDGHDLGAALFTLLLLGIDAMLVAIISLLLEDSLDRLMALTAFTLAVIAIDLLTGGALQLNTVFGYSPIVAGRFAGAGNIVFAVLGVAALVTGTLFAHRGGAGRPVLAVVAAIFAFTVILDGAPQLGSDVGGVLALVPSLTLTWLLLAGRKPSLRVIALALLAGVAVVGVFLVIDLARPPSSQTHLARLFEDTVTRGPGSLVTTIERKATSNLGVFTSTIWTLFVPPALLVMAYLLRRPSGRWQLLAERYPRLRAGLIGGLVLAVLGFAVNDSGIVIPAIMLSFLVPMALLVHLAMDAESRNIYGQGEGR
jgi:hypothetical protein